MGEREKAETAFLRSAELSHDSPGSLASLGHFYARCGRREEAPAILRKLEAIARTTYVSPYTFGLVCIGLDRRDDAFRWLDKALDERSSALPFVNVNPRFDPLRDDPRLRKLSERLGL